MASPAVAGAAALVWSYFPQFSPLQLAQHLKNSSDNIDALPGNQLYVHKLGYGRLNMFRALTDTLKPAIKLDNVLISDNNDQVFTMNDTLNLQCDFINYLAPSQNLKITMRCSSPYVQVLDSVFNAGIQPQMANFSNPPQGFRIKLLQGIPSSHDIEIQFEYQDIQYSGYDYYFTTVNIDFLDLNVNNIATTITSKGILGYNDNYNFQQGIGFQFENSSSLISCAGLMIGRANNQVSDNVYGFVNAFDSDFYPVSSVAYINPPVSGDMQISGEFNDSGAGVQKLNVRVLQNHFAWNSAGNENFIICEYNIINQESSALTNVFAGMFADWELNIRSLNRASTNTAQRFGFAYSTDSSWFAAIQLLTPGNFQHYAIDNDGQDGSVNLNDGFSTTEKFMVLSNTRLTSGNGPFGNNVSNVVSSGPYSIPSGDTLHVAFALHVAYTSADLQQSVINAQQSWNNMLNAGVASADLNAITVYPNPFTEDFIVSVYPEAGLHSLKITDLNGRVVFQSETFTEREIRVSASGLQAGMYLLHINGNESIVKKIIKLQTQE